MSMHPGRWLASTLLSVVGLAWIIDTNPWSGPVVVVLSASHGIHVNDWVTVALWAVAYLLVSPVRSLASWRRLQRAFVDRPA